MRDGAREIGTLAALSGSLGAAGFGRGFFVEHPGVVVVLARVSALRMLLMGGPTASARRAAFAVRRMVPAGVRVQALVDFAWGPRLLAFRVSGAFRKRVAAAASAATITGNGVACACGGKFDWKDVEPAGGRWRVVKSRFPDLSWSVAPGRCLFCKMGVARA